MSGRTRKANRYVKRAMCQAAWAASHTKNTYLSAFYRRMSIRKGAPKAVMALAHHLLTIVFQVISREEHYKELGADYYDQRDKPRVAARLVARLIKLGYYVDLTPAEPNVSAIDIPAPSAVEAECTDAIPLAPPKRRRGRPCKCTERGIPCKHATSGGPISVIQQASAPDKFS